VEPPAQPRLVAEVERAGGSWDPVRGCAKEAGSSSAAPLPDDDEVECMGESSRAEAEAVHDAAGREAAIELDEEEPDA
jgi:hypothetical protein